MEKHGQDDRGTYQKEILSTKSETLNKFKFAKSKFSKQET